jgi:hypothetical protein
LERQSAGALQAVPTAQGRQLPPQSTPVSSPFFLPSLQLGVAQRPIAQSSVWQSASRAQGLPKQARQLPPQSTPVSSPSIRWLEQLAGTCTVEPLHTASIAVEVATQACIVAAQSTTVSQLPPVLQRDTRAP